MKKLTTITLLLLAALPLLAAEGDGDEHGNRRTVIVRDGKVLVDENEPLGGKRPYLGVAMIDLTPELREYFGAPKDAGVLVSSISDNSPAAKAGVRVGDIITSVNGKSIGSTWEVRPSIRDKHAGDRINIEVIRGKARQTIVATAEERELPERVRAFDLGELGMLERGEGMRIPMPPGEWRAKIAMPDSEDLHARIRELEQRLQELEKKLQK